MASSRTRSVTYLAFMNLIRANCELLQQGVDLLNRHDDATYSAVDASSFGSGIGSHFRHVLDHYQSFLAGASSSVIDYDDRRRGTTLERERSTAIATLTGMIAAMKSVAVDVNAAVEVRVSASPQGEGIRAQSSFGRELQFLVSHTVHHYALIAIASRMQGIVPDASFGVAPSTLKYRESVRV